MNSVSGRMSRDWNRRARSDALYYVALGKRDQTWQEFVHGAGDLVGGIEAELRRLPERTPDGWKALEIGCGPGRLMASLGRHFSEIHGLDVSSEMVELARKNLAGISHAKVHLGDGAGLSQFSDGFFHLVYSYAVFQHIPRQDVVFNYLQETHRVLRPGGIARFQFNGLHRKSSRIDTWAGVRFDAADIAAFARENGLQLLALEGAGTQYMWATFRKRRQGSDISPPPAPPRAGAIRKITQASCSATVVPASGRFAACAIWIHGLPPDSDLNTLRILAGGLQSRITYLSPMDADGVQQLTAYLPDGITAGLQPIRVLWGDTCLAEAFLRVVPPPARTPRIVSVTDGVFVGSGRNISSRLIRISLEESDRPQDLSVWVDGIPARHAGSICSDPTVPRFEVDFRLPRRTKAGPRQLECRLGRRYMGTFEIRVTDDDRYWWLRRIHPSEVYQAARRMLSKEKLVP